MAGDNFVRVSKWEDEKTLFLVSCERKDKPLGMALFRPERSGKRSRLKKESAEVDLSNDSEES